MPTPINRRNFVANAAASATAMLLGTNLIRSSAKDAAGIFLPERNGEGLMAEVMKYRKIDSHAHVYFSADSPGTQLDFADRLGIQTLLISRPMEPGSKGLPEEFRKCNDLVISCVKQYPNRFIGEMTLNPAFPRESMEELKRCVDSGLVGSKYYNHVKINDPSFYRIIEKFIDLKMIMLMHTPIGKARVIMDPTEPPNISLPEDFVSIAKRYPEAMFQFAHIGGGIDWENACKALTHSPNVFVDVSGSNNEAGMIDFALKYIGEDRLLFGCDNSFYQAVGHVLAANLTESQRRKIFFDNYNAILKRSGRNVD